MSRVIQTVLIKTSLSIQLTVYVPYGYNAHKFSIKLMLQGLMDVNPRKNRNQQAVFIISLIDRHQNTDMN